MKNNMSKCIGCGAPIDIHGFEVSRNQCVYCGTVFVDNQPHAGNSMMSVQGTPVIEDKQAEISRPVAPTVTINTNFSKVKPAPRTTAGGYPILTKKGAALIVVTLIVSVIVVARSWTANNANNVLTTHWEVAESVFEVAEERVDVYEETTHFTNEAYITQMGTSLVGTWYWLGSPYYVFNEDGRGEMIGSDIRWVAENGVLYICITPDFCGDSCVLPTEWYYTFDGNELTLSGRTSGLSFNYTLAQDEVSADETVLNNEYLETPYSSQSSYPINILIEFQRYHITVNDIFIVTDARTPPDEGNKHIGISFTIRNVSGETRSTSRSQVSVFVDGFLTNHSSAVSSAIGRSQGSNSFSNSLPDGRSVHVHYGVEIPIGTTEIEIEINCGTFGAGRQVEILRLNVPQG
ncbi:MAG: hypothetical protein FWE42_00995 [Defluviitaleaceae bacterium]|nr:hypothetical protein [Defluviitaleaceae bacterium]